MATYKSYNQALFPYAYGLGLSNNATTPNTKLDVAVGSILNSTKEFQINLDVAVTIDATVTGLNGLDTGSLAASTLYYVYAISDPQSYNIPGCMISASSTPYMPYGYSAWALIGYVATDAASHFLKGYWTDDKSSLRTFMYDAPQEVLAAGAAAAYTAVDLSALVPDVQDTPVYVQSTFTAAAAGDIENLQPFGATGDAVTVIGQRAGAIASQDLVMARLDSGAAKVEYKVSAGTLKLDVAGYQFAI